MITAGPIPIVSAKTNRALSSWLRGVAFVALALFFILPASADLKYVLVSREILMQRLQDAPLKNSDRVTELEKMFRAAGCNPTEEPVKGLHQPNVMCVLPGSTGSTIVIGGHLDHVEEGTGVIDDWSGASMLPSLYQSLASQPRMHTFLFIGFAGEEDGLVGSDFYTKNLKPEQRKQIATMVNLECLGIGKTEVWTSHSEPILIRMLVAVAQSMKIPLGGINVEQVGTTDSESFAHYHIPRITITAISQDTWQLLHTKKDNIAAINPELYYDSYRLIAPYLVLLDQQLPTDGSPLRTPR
ncbi:MAG TPA: M28 family peptidase [Terriglobales bacterium]|jgi:hypothetical protein